MVIDEHTRSLVSVLMVLVYTPIARLHSVSVVQAASFPALLPRPGAVDCH
jgi:hypothetical protein